MKALKIISLITLFFLSVWLQTSLLGSYLIGIEALTNIVTSLSIFFGFYIASLSILGTSEYVSELYNYQDPKKKSQTLLDRLVNNYRVGLGITILSIAYFLILNIFFVNKDHSMLFSDIFAIPFLFVLLLVFTYSFWMLHILLKIILQEAKRKTSK
jgi:hypothetical protein